MGRAALTCAPISYEPILSMQGRSYAPVYFVRLHKEIAARALQFKHLKVKVDLYKQRIILKR